jgi:hypothetical protein
MIFHFKSSFLVGIMNWITEFTIMKKAIPKEWVDIIKTENSKKV